MSSKITTELLENRQMSVAIEVEQQRVDNELRKAARKLARDYRIPGFRKGKAPYNIIVQFLGMQALYGEFLDDLGQEVYMQALEDGEFEPYAQASLDDVSFDPLTYKLTVPLEPIVDLGDYRSIRVEDKPAEVDEEQVTEQLETYRTQYAGWEDTDRPSEYGDMMNIDVRSIIAPETEGEEEAADADEEETVVLNETDWDVTPDEDSPMEPPGFDEALLGMTPGEEKTFDLSWPEDGQSVYAGKTASFTVTLNTNQAYEKPALDDDLAQLVGPDFETLDDLMTNVRETLQEQAQAQAENDYLESAFTAAMEMAEMDYPPVVIEDQIDSMVNELGGQLRQYGINDVEEYLQQTGQSLESYREGVRDSAKTIAERNLIISEIWKAEQIEVSDDDIEEKIGEIVGEPDDVEELVDELLEETELLEDEVEEVIEDLVEEVADEIVEEIVDVAVTGEVDEALEADIAEDIEAIEELEDLEEELEELEDELEELQAEESAQREAMSEIFRSGGGRSMLEAQILQEKSVERLLAIARGDELPELKSAEELEAEVGAEDESDAAESDGAVSDDAEAEVEAAVENEDESTE